MMNPTTWVTILNWSPYLQSQNAKYMFKILLPLHIFIEEWIIHALVGILLWNKQIKPKKSKIKYKKRKKHLLFPLLLWLLLSFSLIVITIIIIVFTLYWVYIKNIYIYTYIYIYICIWNKFGLYQNTKLSR